MGGLVVTSTVVGQVVSRTGRYKPFPVAGTALIAVAFVLLSTLDAGTRREVTATSRCSYWAWGTMQVLVLAA